MSQHIQDTVVDVLQAPVQDSLRVTEFTTDSDLIECFGLVSEQTAGHYLHLL